MIEIAVTGGLFLLKVGLIHGGQHMCHCLCCLLEGIVGRSSDAKTCVSPADLSGTSQQSRPPEERAVLFTDKQSNMTTDVTFDTSMVIP